jgi:putative sigma-54 modulation protein
MNVLIQTVHFVADEKLTQWVTQKTKKINHFHDGITKIEIFLKLDNVVHHIKDKVVEICVHVPKHDFFVKDTAKTFEAAFDGAFDALVAQIKKHKQKLAA